MALPMPLVAPTTTAVFAMVVCVSLAETAKIDVPMRTHLHHIIRGAQELYLGISYEEVSLTNLALSRQLCPCSLIISLQWAMSTRCIIESELRANYRMHRRRCQR
jgi:hypothetical protein